MSTARHLPISAAPRVRQVFRDPQLQALFELQGYVVVPALDAAAIVSLTEAYADLVDPQLADFESTMNSPSPRHKQQVHLGVIRHLAPVCERYLFDYQPVVGNFVRKLPTDDSAVPAHQDWTMCDETQFTGVNVWVPLTDVGEHNGALHLLKGGHRLPPAVRGTGIPPAFDGHLFQDHRRLTAVPMQAGQALIYDLRCLHMSPPNRGATARLAAGLPCIPCEATPLHHVFDAATGRLDCYEADAGFYSHFTYGINRVPDQARLLSSTAGFEPVSFSAQVQRDLLDQQHPPAMIFQDAGHQASYERDGYVLVDALDAQEVAGLLKEFQRLTAWFEQGFLSSICVAEPGYKQAVDALLEPVGQRILARYMRDYVAVVSTFMAKGAGDDSAMYPHQDWTLVDETRHASFNIWIPLVDTTPHNGALSIMRGGHKLPFTLRGSCVPDALTDKSAFMPDRLTTLRMKAGQALIYDHRCIHASAPNRSGQVRPACAISVAPRQAELVHYFYRADVDLLQRYRADKAFFFGHVATQFQLPQSGTLLDERRAGAFHAFSAEELAPVFAMQLKPPVPGFWQRLFRRQPLA